MGVLNDPRRDLYLMAVAGSGFSWTGHFRDFDWGIAEALLHLHRAGIEVVAFHVHHEMVCEVDFGANPAMACRSISMTPDWFPGCPLAAEAMEAMRYCK